MELNADWGLFPGRILFRGFARGFFFQGFMPIFWMARFPWQHLQARMAINGCDTPTFGDIQTLACEQETDVFSVYKHRSWITLNKVFDVLGQNGGSVVTTAAKLRIARRAHLYYTADHMHILPRC